MASGKSHVAGSCSGDFHGELATSLPWQATGIQSAGAQVGELCAGMDALALALAMS